MSRTLELLRVVGRMRRTAALARGVVDVQRRKTRLFLDEQTKLLTSEEVQQYKDVVILPCAENHHEGKVLHWFHYAVALKGGVDNIPYDYIAKMDQDVFVWPEELHAHLPGFARSVDLVRSKRTKTGSNATFMFLQYLWCRKMHIMSSLVCSWPSV